METVFFARINAGLHVGNILPHCGAHVARFSEEIFSELRDMAAGDPESVMHHEDLAVGDVTRTNADNRNG